MAGEIHNFLTLGRAARRGGLARWTPRLCVGCDVCVTMCPFGAITLVDRPAGTAAPGRGQGRRQAGRHRPAALPRLRHLRRRLPRGRRSPTTSSDEALFGRLAHPDRAASSGRSSASTAGSVPAPPSVWAASGATSTRSACASSSCPASAGVSALHIVEAARLGAAGVFLAGCAEGRCQYRSGDASAAEQRGIAEELLAEAGLDVPIELWHLCAVDRTSVGRRIRGSSTREATGETLSARRRRRASRSRSSAAPAAGCGRRSARLRGGCVVRLRR